MSTKEFKPKSVRVGTMILLDNYTNLMRCSICGREHYGCIQPKSNGRLYKSNWKCRNGCRKDNKVKQGQFIPNAKNGGKMVRILKKANRLEARFQALMKKIEVNNNKYENL